MIQTKRVSFSRVFVASLIGVAIPQFALAWGEVGHSIIAQVGSGLTRAGAPFWNANAQSMMKLTTVPDVVWKELPTNNIEKPTHFFQPDSYFSDIGQFAKIPRMYPQAVAQFGADFVNKNGTSVWRAQQFYALGVQAVTKGDFVTALQMAGVMSHYLGDMSQPLHDTKNYDGQETGQIGIHKFFETDNIQAANRDQLVAAVRQQAANLLNDPKFVAKIGANLSDVVFFEVGRAYMFKDTILNIDKSQGRTGNGAQSLLQLATARMADGAATLAYVLSRMWADAGNPSFGQTVNVGIPQWVPPTYQTSSVGSPSNQINRHSPLSSLSTLFEEDDDDCYR